MNQLFSVLMPTYNQAEYLGAAIESVLAQTYENFELVIVNDGSTDETPGIMVEYAGRDSRIKIFHKENGGTASALNYALAKAKAPWACWLSSDDLFMESHLQLHADLIEKKPDAWFIHSDYNCLIEAENKIIPANMGINIPPLHLQSIKLLRLNYVSGITIAARTELLKEIGFNESLNHAQDYDMWMEISLRRPFHWIATPSAITRVHKGQGTFSYPLGGLLDGAFVGLNAINRHPLKDFLIFADLGNADIHGAIMNELLACLLDENSYMVKAGFAIALANRICEWIHYDAPPAAKKNAIAAIENFAAQYRALLGEDNIALMNSILTKPIDKYQPYDGRILMAARIEKHKKHGNSAMAEELQKYLNANPEIKFNIKSAL